MTSSGSISFDGAAGFYDKTRSLSPEAAARVTDLLAAELRGREDALEVGVGTGRIALPLVGRGVSMVGLDLAHNMLARLIENAGGVAPFPLLQGDATRVPIRDDSFDAGIASWVLHLISDWREVLSELVRVVRPGGILLIDVGREHQSITTELTWRFRDLAGNDDWPRGVKSYEDIDEALGPLGARGRDLDTVVDVMHMPIEDHIARLEEGIYSVAWGVDEETRRRAAADLRVWAADRFGSLEDPRPIEAPHVWRAYELG